MNLRKILAVNKARFTRGYSWVGMLGMGLVISKTVQDIIKFYFPLPIWIIFPAGVFLLWLIGYFDHKKGFLAEELNHNIENNTLLIDLIKKGGKEKND